MTEKVKYKFESIAKNYPTIKPFIFKLENGDIKLANAKAHEFKEITL